MAPAVGAQVSDVTVIISVVGESTIDSPPERAILHVTAGFDTDVKLRTVESTVRLVNELSAEMAALTGAGRPATWFSVGSLRTWSWRPHSDAGEIMPMRYAASAPLQVKFRDFPELSAFASRIGARAGVKLDRVEWALTEAALRGVKESALAGAVANARKRALVMAKAAGFADVVASQIADPGLLEGERGGETGFPSAKAEMRMASMDSGGGAIDPEAIDLKPEDVSVSATVHARFAAR